MDGDELVLNLNFDVQARKVCCLFCVNHPSELRWSAFKGAMQTSLQVRAAVP